MISAGVGLVATVAGAIPAVGYTQDEYEKMTIDINPDESDKTSLPTLHFLISNKSDLFNAYSTHLYCVAEIIQYRNPRGIGMGMGGLTRSTPVDVGYIEAKSKAINYFCDMTTLHIGRYGNSPVGGDPRPGPRMDKFYVETICLRIYATYTMLDHEFKYQSAPYEWVTLPSGA